MPKQSKTERTFWSIGGISIIISIGIFTARAAESDKPINEQLVEAAWRSFATKDYSLATRKCTELVDEFRPSADREQSTLEQKKAPVPVKGKPQENERKLILERGLLNDVATCYFIIGRSEEFQGRVETARVAYSQAAKYTYARTWDPKGWFWSPSEAAQDRMSGLK